MSNFRSPRPVSSAAQNRMPLRLFPPTKRSPLYEHCIISLAVSDSTDHGRMHRRYGSFEIPAVTGAGLRQSTKACSDSAKLKPTPAVGKTAQQIGLLIAFPTALVSEKKGNARPRRSPHTPGRGRLTTVFLPSLPNTA